MLTNDGGFSTARAMTKERTRYELRWARTEAESEAIKTAESEILAARCRAMTGYGLCSSITAGYTRLTRASALVKPSWCGPRA
jgi:hypothetical protein